MKDLITISFASCGLILTSGFDLKAGEQAGPAAPGLNSGLFEVVPASYDKALRNPLKGFTTRGIHDHEWATLAQTYIKWNEIENDASDDIDKIRRVTDKLWGDVAARNIKVIPRVYLHWSGDRKYWPADMTPDDYTSPQFQQRVVRLVERLGILWDTDPRVAFVELGIFGKWGEQEQPFPSLEMQKMVAEACARAFKHRLVSVRRNWEIFQSRPFGEYWDSWAHFDQMWAHGNSIARLNSAEGRYLQAYIGGEVAYDWGNRGIQPGLTPTESVANELHRNFVINTIRWLHCTQLRWIENYDTSNAAARAGADLIQQAFGYRYILEKAAFTASVTHGILRVVLQVKNTGSAPFYYDWPLEAALLDPQDRRVVWRQTFPGIDLRDWLPGDGWTPPQWLSTSSATKSEPDKNWMDGIPGWATPPKTYQVSGDFRLTIPTGRYLLALAVLDPAGQLPSLRFATSQYFKGGRHPIGMVAVNQGGGGPLPPDLIFDDPAKDGSLHYIPRTGQ